MVFSYLECFDLHGEVGDAIGQLHCPYILRLLPDADQAVGHGFGLGQIHTLGEGRNARCHAGTEARLDLLQPVPQSSTVSCNIAHCTASLGLAKGLMAWAAIHSMATVPT